jgi:hypothetical protein
MRRIVTLLERDEQGVALIVVALSMFMLMAVATLAIDGGLVHTDRRQAQNVADNASLAAAWAICEGRDPTAAALTTAAANGFDNDGVSNTVNVTELGDNRALVEITGSRDAQFGQAIGNETLEVVAEATAACTSYPGGAGAIPFGAPPSGFDGGLQRENPCGLNSGNCGRLYALRLDGYGEVGEDTIKNIAYGTDRLLIPWTTGKEYVNCSLTTEVACNVLPSNTGVSAGHLGQGFRERFLGPTGAYETFLYQGLEYNNDSLAEVLGDATATPLFDPSKQLDAGKPPAWDEGIHGPWSKEAVANHYWVSGTIAKCESPRLASIVIVTADMSYDPYYYSGGPYPDPWPNGSKNMKVLGHYYVYIDNPNNPGDFIGSGNLKTASTKVLWVDPENIKCATTGFAPGPSATNPPIFEVSLEG